MRKDFRREYLGEFGEPREHYRRLRRFHLMLRSYGAVLAPMTMRLPEGQSLLDPSDKESPRLCARSDGRGAFVFFTNYQDHATLNEQRNLVLELALSNGNVRLPERGNLSLPVDASAILPVGLDLDGVCLKGATVQPVTRFARGDDVWHVFTALPGFHPELQFPAQAGLEISAATGLERTADGGWYWCPNPGLEAVSHLRRSNAPTVSLLVLDDNDSLDLSRVSLSDGEHLAISQAALVDQAKGLLLSSTNPADFSVALLPGPKSFIAEVPLTNGTIGPFRTWTARMQPAPQVPEILRPDPRRAVVELRPEHLAGLRDLWLTVEYEGDTAGLYLDGELIADHFHDGRPWRISLRRFLPRVLEYPLVLRITPTRESRSRPFTFSEMAAIQRDDSGLKGQITSLRWEPEFAVLLR